MTSFNAAAQASQADAQKHVEDNDGDAFKLWSAAFEAQMHKVTLTIANAREESPGIAAGVLLHGGLTVVSCYQGFDPFFSSQAVISAISFD